MADVLGTNPIIIDLTATNTRQILPAGQRVFVKRVLIEGTKPASGTNFRLRQTSTSGPEFWKHQDIGVAAVSIRAQDDIEVFTEGIFFDGGGGGAWGATAVILVYLG